MTKSIDLSKVVQSRIYQTGNWTLQNENASSVGCALASLSPTLIDTMLSFSSGDSISETQIDNWNQIKKIISGDCKFGVMMYANQYSDFPSVKYDIDQIKLALSPDVFLMDFLSTQYATDPSLWEAVGNYLHDCGVIYTGHIWDSRYVPSNLDYITTDDVNDGLGSSPSNYVLRQSLQEMRTKYPALPIVLELNNNPQNGEVGSNLCYQWGIWSSLERQAYINQRGDGQLAEGYNFAFPVFFPDYPVFTAFDTPKDQDLFSLIQSFFLSTKIKEEKQ